jgi:hypothetical protein
MCRLLVGFISDVCEELELQTVTIHRGVNYLDRLLSKRTDIPRALYQLMATACILVAGLIQRSPSVLVSCDMLHAPCLTGCL